MVKECVCAGLFVEFVFETIDSSATALVPRIWVWFRSGSPRKQVSLFVNSVRSLWLYEMLKCWMRGVSAGLTSK